MHGPHSVFDFPDICVNRADFRSKPAIAAVHGPHSVILVTVRLYTEMPEVCRWLTNNQMFSQTDNSWHDYRALNQTWSGQPTLVGRAITKNTICVV